MSIWQQISDGSLQTGIQSKAAAFLHGTVLQEDFLVQIIAVAIAYMLAYAVQRGFVGKIKKLSAQNPFGKMLKLHFFSIVWMTVLWLFLALFTPSEIAHQTLRMVTSLVTAWVFISCLGLFVRDPVWSKFLTISIWTLAALNIVGLLNETVMLLDSVSFTFGKRTITVLSVVEGFIALALLLWLSSNLTRVLENALRACRTSLPPRRCFSANCFTLLSSPSLFWSRSTWWALT